MQAMNWDDLRIILAVARAGTLAAAARRLAVDQTTVARRLAAAETDLGMRLFERVAGTLHPTEAGEAAIRRAATVEAQIQGLEAGITADTAPSGLVRLSAVPMLVDRLLIPALPAFVRDHPQIRLDLVAEPRNLDLRHHEADIALRLARPESGGDVLARRIGRLDYAAYGLRGAGPLPWVTYGEGLRHLPQARWLAAAAERDGAAAVSVNDAEALIAALHAGLGRSLLPSRIAETAPQLERLHPAIALSRPVWLLTRRSTRQEGRIAATIAWIGRLFMASGAAPAG